MKSTLIAICLLALIGSTGFVGTVLSQPAVQAPKPVTKHGQPEMPAGRPLRPIGSLGNMIKMTNHESPRQQAIAKLMETQACPESRVNYFKGIFEREELRLLGWHHEISKVETIEGVEHVTVLVHPIVTEKNGRPIRLTGATEEVYAIEKNVLVPVRNGTLGSPTGIIRG